VEKMKNTSLGKRQLQAMETRKKIYETARQLILEHGFEHVSVDLIAEAAGVSKGTFYVHFESKDALAAALVEEYTNTVDMDYKALMAGLPENTSIDDAIILLSERISDVIADNIGLENIRVLYKAHLAKTVNTTPAMSYNRELYKLFAELLQTGISRGDIRDDISVESLSRHLILAIRGIVFEWCIRYPDFDLKEQIKEHFKILLYGIKK